MVKQCNIDLQHIVVDFIIDFVCLGHFGLVSFPLRVALSHDDIRPISISATH